MRVRTVRKLLSPTSARGIDPRKVLLVRNSNAAQSALSTSVSDWYAAARGLDGGAAGDYFWISFDFGNGLSNLLTKLAADFIGVTNPNYPDRGVLGTGNGRPNIVLDHATTPVTCSAHSTKIPVNQVGLSFLASLAHVINTHAIEAVIVLPGVPAAVQGPYSGGAGVYYGQATEVICANAPGFNGSTPYLRQGASTRFAPRVHGALTLDGSTSGVTRSRPVRGIANVFPTWGRVGWENLDTFSSLAQVQTIVGNAIAAESQNNLSRPTVIGGTAYIFGGGTRQGTAANFAGRDMGLLNLGYVSTPGDYGAALSQQPGNNNDEFDYWQTKPAFAGSPLAELYVGQGLQSIQAPGGGQLSLFGLSAPILAPLLTPEFSSRLAFQAGGWAFAWLSSAELMGRFSLLNGASLSFLVTGEPFNTGIPDIDSLTTLILEGRSGCEAVYSGATSNTLGVWLSSSTAVTTAWGDPLYAPYFATRVV